MLSVHKVNAKTLTVTIHARREFVDQRTICGQKITIRDTMLSPRFWGPQTAVTCEKCKAKGAK